MEKNIIRAIDFNCNLAEVSNMAHNDNEFQLVDYVSSVNVACGISSGTPLSIKSAIEFCKFKNKVIGASIELPNSVINPLELSEEDIEAIVLYQLGAISSFAKAYSLNIEHVRPSGLMYKLAASDLEFSLKIAKAIKKFSKWFLYYGESCDVLEEVSNQLNINIAREICINKNYNNGLINFDKPDISDTDYELSRIQRIVNSLELENEDKSISNVKVDTLHFSSKANNTLELLSKASDIVVPRPVNFNYAALSGWVD